MHEPTKNFAALAWHAVLACAAVVIAACASSAPTAPSTPQAPRYVVVHDPAPVAAAAPAVAACPRATTLDAKLLADEAACLLAQYVRIDTTNPPGNEVAAATFLQELLAREGIEAVGISDGAQPARMNLLATVPGSSHGKAKGIGLAHHMDVVPATPSEWSVPPFAAEIRDGYLWGRGSLDNKGGGIIDVLAVVMAKRLGTPFPRDVTVFALSDEEAGGGHGSRYLTKALAEQMPSLECVLNEGGVIAKLPGGHVAYSVEVAQKAPLWLRLTARGPGGHGSSPSPDMATTHLVHALARLADYRFPIVVLPEVQALYAAKAPGLPEPLREGARDLKTSLTKAKFRDAFMSDPHNAGLVQNTVAITQLRGSDKENVISAEASAVVDMRLLPGQDPQAVIAQVKTVLADDTIEITPLLSWQAHSSPRDTTMFRAIEAHAQKHDPGAPVVANVIGGFTDCNAFRAAGVTCYGFTPLRLSPDAFAGLHGKDERIEVAALGQAVVELYELLMSVPAQ